MRSILAYDMPQFKAEYAADRVIHNIPSFDACFKCAHAKGESITLCIAYGVGSFDLISIEK